MDIDIVVTWVDGSDPEWRNEKRKYLPGNTDGDNDERFREWGLIRYWFRCIEKNAPWVRKIHFVTWGHLPKWLDTSNPRLHIVNHKDYLPEEARPCFNSTLLERYFHKIPGIAEHFVYFNDDFYLLGVVDKDFFFKNGLPKDMLAFQPVVANPSNPVMSHHFLNNTLVLSKYFDKRKNVMQHKGNYFHIGYPPLYFFYNMLELGFPRYTGLYSVHNATPFLKSVYERVWEKEGDYLRSLDGNHFRDDTDVNQYLFREWGKLEGKFVPANVTRHVMYSEMSDDNNKLLRLIADGGKRSLKPDIKMLCLNDTGLVSDNEKVAADFIKAFEKAFPEPCSFEKKDL